MSKLVDLTGKKLGRLTAIRLSDRPTNGSKYWHCLCDCGVSVEVRSQDIRSGKTTSCGCYQRQVSSERVKSISTTHGMSGTPVYRAWQNMIKRCSDKNHKHYSDYGGRGITFSEQWREFEVFFSDMGDRPSGLSLERIDNNGNYEPENCKWATAMEQANNKRSNVVIKYDGMRLTIAQWARRIGVDRSTINARIKANWPIDELLGYKPRDKNSRKVCAGVLSKQSKE